MNGEETRWWYSGQRPLPRDPPERPEDGTAIAPSSGGGGGGSGAGPGRIGEADGIITHRAECSFH